MSREYDVRVQGDAGFLVATLTGDDDLVDRALLALEDEFEGDEDVDFNY